MIHQVHQVPILVEKSIPIATIVEWAFKGFVTGIFALAVKYIAGVKTSIEKLNVQIAIVIERVQGHEKRISFLERKPKK